MQSGLWQDLTPWFCSFPLSAVSWAKSYGGTNHDTLEGIALESPGYIVIAGEFQSTSIVFNNAISLTNPHCSPSSYICYPDAFVAKLTISGVSGTGHTGVASSLGAYRLNQWSYACVWQDVRYAKSFGGSAIENANSVAVDSMGRILVGGSFESSTVTFGSTTLTNSGAYDAFIFSVVSQSSSTSLARSHSRLHTRFNPYCLTGQPWVGSSNRRAIKPTRRQGPQLLSPVAGRAALPQWCRPSILLHRYGRLSVMAYFPFFILALSFLTPLLALPNTA